MTQQNQSQTFQPGIRFSFIDAIFIFLMAVLSMALFIWEPKLSFACALAPFQFFLFCNIFRVRRVPEFIWAGLFIAIVISTFMLQWPWWVCSLFGLILGAVVIFYETRQPSYHGIGWKRINPDLKAWFYRQ